MKSIILHELRVTNCNRWIALDEDRSSFNRRPIDKSSFINEELSHRLHWDEASFNSRFICSGFQLDSVPKHRILDNDYVRIGQMNVGSEHFRFIVLETTAIKGNARFTWQNLYTFTTILFPSDSSLVSIESDILKRAVFIDLKHRANRCWDLSSVSLH